MTADGKARVVAEAAGDNSHDLPGVPFSKPHPCQANPREAARSSADGKGSGLLRRSPLQAVRAHCRWCCGGNAREVTLCTARRCPLWLLRRGHRPTSGDVEQNANVALHPSERRMSVGELHASVGAVLRAIRRRCIDCSGGSLAAVRTCKRVSCPLHPFRMGENPNIRLSPERKAALLTRLPQ